MNSQFEAKHTKISNSEKMAKSSKKSLSENEAKIQKKFDENISLVIRESLVKINSKLELKRAYSHHFCEKPKVHKNPQFSQLTTQNFMLKSSNN